MPLVARGGVRRPGCGGGTGGGARHGVASHSQALGDTIDRVADQLGQDVVRFVDVLG